MLIREWSLDDVAVVDVAGRLTLEAGTAVRDTVCAAFARGRRKLVLDLTRVTTLDAAGLGELAEVHRSVHARRRRREARAPEPRRERAAEAGEAPLALRDVRVRGVGPRQLRSRRPGLCHNRATMLRRAFFSRFPAAAAFAGFGSIQTPPPSPPATSRFEPARHPQDDWFDQVPGRHRVCFDTWLAAKFDEAVAFAGNYIRANASGYGLDAHDLAVVIVVRHRTAPFAFNDAIWAKYGKTFSERQSFVDPKTGQAPTTNVYGAQLGRLVAQGVQLAVCNMSTRAYSQMLAGQAGKSEDEVYKELTSSTVGNAHFVPAGIVAATRAQERGYAIVSIG